MNPLIPKEQAEKAATVKISRICECCNNEFDFELSLTNINSLTIWKCPHVNCGATNHLWVKLELPNLDDVIEAANEKFSSYATVLEECEATLTNARSTLILCTLIDKSGQSAKEVESIESTLQELKEILK